MASLPIRFKTKRRRRQQQSHLMTGETSLTQLLYRAQLELTGLAVAPMAWVRTIGLPAYSPTPWASRLDVETSHSCPREVCVLR